MQEENLRNRSHALAYDRHFARCEKVGFEPFAD